MKASSRVTLSVTPDRASEVLRVAIEQREDVEAQVSAVRNEASFMEWTRKVRAPSWQMRLARELKREYPDLDLNRAL